MGTVAVRFKLMPKDLDVDLEKLVQEVKSKIESIGGVFSSSVEEPIAFGLKALVISFAYPDNKEIDEAENQVAEIDGISSVEMIDYRRAIG